MVAYLQCQVKCIAACVRLAPAPWSLGTENVVQLGISRHTNLTADLKEQQQLSKLKTILRRYNLHKVNFEQTMNAQVSLFENRLLVIISFIISVHFFLDDFEKNSKKRQ